MIKNKLSPLYHSDRRQGLSLVFVFVLIVIVGFMTMVSVNTTKTYSVTASARELQFRARQIAESAAAQALVKIKEGGYTAPYSGSSGSPAWISFDQGDMYYYSSFDSTTDLTTVRAWGRIRANSSAQNQTVAPDDVTWDETGWVTSGLEIAVKGNVFVPEVPMYFGNGGIEKPPGGFSWSGSSDLSDPSSWGVVSSSSAASWQSNSVSLEVSSLDYPTDYLYSGGSPTTAGSNPHPYKIWSSQNAIGQFNVEAWFKNSAGSGDPTTGVSPSPTASYFDVADSSSPDYPYPIDRSVPDVQAFAHDLYSTYSATSTNLGPGDRTGVYGDLSNPGITFVTGNMTVPAAKTFEGAGILVIRDDYDPNSDTNNRPSRSASLVVNGTFKWTGLVIIAGWRPTIRITNGATANIVGAMFGEDSVQSGGEVSLDSATIILRVDGTMKVMYSNGLFRQGGLIHHLLPRVSKEVVGIRHL